MATTNRVKKPNFPVARSLSLLLLGLASATLAPIAQATLLTGLPSATTSAGSCYFGCGNAHFDHGNIIDGDYGSSGNTGLNSWNSGYWGGWVQINFGAVYQLDRIELYGANGYYDPYTLLASQDGLSWSSIATGGYHVEPNLSRSDTYLGVKYGAVHDVANSTLANNVVGQYLRYSVNAGTPHWGYLFELQVEGHSPASSSGTPQGGSHSVPEPGSLALLGLGMMGLAGMRRRRG